MTDTSTANTETQALNEQQAKKIEFYSESVAAWYNSRLEHDKSLLTLSAAGVGALVALLTTIGVKGKIEFAMYVFALASFLTCIFSTLFIFKHNSTYIEKVIQDKAETSDPTLSKLDQAALWSFLVGVTLTAGIGLIAAFNSSGESMAKETKNLFQDSFNGSLKLSPELLKKSFNGALNLAPPEPAVPAPAAPASSSKPVLSAIPTNPANSGVSQATGDRK